MSKINTNFTLQGFEHPLAGVMDIEGFDNPITSLEPYWNQRLLSQGTYDPASKKLVFTIPGIRPDLTITVKFSEISPALAQQLRTVASGGTFNTTFKSVYPSIVGMHIEPVV